MMAHEMNHFDMLLVDEDMRCLFQDNTMDLNLLDDISPFKNEINETTDEDSSVSSPLSDFSDSSTSPSHKQEYPIATAYPWMPCVVPTSIKLPFAMAVNEIQQKRTLDDMNSNVQSKRTKHEIRLMKNRESANKSRLRRKNQVTDLSTENIQLKTLLAEKDSLLAARDATIKSLTDQLHFLRGLVSSGTTMTESIESSNFNKSKLAAPAAGIVLCAFIFGFTLFSDPYANSAAKVAQHRRSMRVVHGMNERSMPSNSNNPYMATTPIGMLYLLGEYGGFLDSLWLNILAIVIVSIFCVVLIRIIFTDRAVHVNVNVNEKGTVVNRLCHRASRWVSRNSSTAKLGKL